MLKLMDGGSDLCLRFVRELPVTGVSISVFNRSGRQSSVCSHDTLSARIDELQFELGEGPQWETVRTGASVLIPDVTGDFHSAWPMFGAAIRDLDVGALCTIPLIMGAVTVGVVGRSRRCCIRRRQHNSGKYGGGGSRPLDLGRRERQLADLNRAAFRVMNRKKRWVV